MNLLNGRWKFIAVNPFWDEFQKLFFEYGGRWNSGAHVIHDIRNVPSGLVLLEDGKMWSTNAYGYVGWHGQETTILQAIEWLKDALANEKKRECPEYIGSGKEVMVVKDSRWCLDVISHITDENVVFISGHKTTMTRLMAPVDFSFLGQHYNTNNHPKNIINLATLINDYDLSKMPGTFFKKG